MNTSLSADQRAGLLLAAMDIDQKVAVLIQSGGPGVPELGIPAIRGKDGCCGASVTDADSTALPVGIGLASTFDVRAASQYGAAMGEEARDFGFNSLAGPTLDLNTTSLNGRMWEAFGEDPLLSGTVAAAQINGIQSQDVSVIAKHYNLNNQETRRGDVDAVVDERTLQEVYTRPWETVVRESNPGSIMCAFNQVNGVYACSSDELQNVILKEQLGFEGYISSDFNASHAFADYEAGMDVSGPSVEFSGPNLKQAVLDGKVSATRLDDAVRRVLRTFFRLGIIDNPPVGSFDSPQPASTPLDEATVAANDKVARSVADESAVLLRNDAAALPLPGAGSVAVIGADADHYIDGGGSGAVQRPTELTTILDGITARASGEISYRAGTDPVSLGDTLPGPAPLPSSVLTDDSGDPGLTARYYAGTQFSGEPALERNEPNANLRTGISNDAINTSQLPGIGFFLVAQPTSARWTGTLTAPATGTYQLSVSNYGTGSLAIDGTTVIDDPGTVFATRNVSVDLVQGEEYELEAKYQTDRPGQFAGGLNDQAGSQFRLGWVPPAGVVSPSIAAAVEAARTADTAVIVARDYIGEAADRGSLVLPQGQDALIEAVAAVNPRTVVVLATSGPVSMPWLDEVPAVLEAWYPGQAQGRSVAALLYGDVNPSGKLPVTFPVDDAQLAAVGVERPFEQVDELKPTTEYTDGIFVGYKAYDRQGAVPLFPFGYGLSYTSFDYSPAVTVSTVDTSAAIAATAAVTVTNSGTVAGSEVVQAYVGELPAPVETAGIALAGYARVSLEPGQSKTVQVPIDRRALQYWDVNTDRWVTAAGDVALSVGSSSTDLRSTTTVSVPAGDTTPPVVTVTASPSAPNGSAGWYTRPITLTAAASDDQTAQPRIEASINGGSYTLVTSPRRISTDGVYSILVRAVDEAGNVSPVVDASGKLDRTAPTASAVADPAHRYRVQLTATDQTSGVSRIQYRYQIRVGSTTRMTSWRTYSSPVLFGLSDHVKIEYRAVDNAGNVSGVRSYR